MEVSCLSTLRDGPSGLLTVRQVSEIIDLILRSAPQERVSKDAEPYCLVFFQTLQGCERPLVREEKR